MHPANQEHTSFIIEQGQFCYKVMMFELKNVGATYQRMVTKMFVLQIEKNMEVYVDDMLIKSRMAEQYEEYLFEAFRVMLSHWIKLNLTKCAFRVRSDKFLCFIVHQRGIEANPEMILDILDMSLPANLK